CRVSICSSSRLCDNSSCGRARPRPAASWKKRRSKRWSRSHEDQPTQARNGHDHTRGAAGPDSAAADSSESGRRAGCHQGTEPPQFAGSGRIPRPHGSRTRVPVQSMRRHMPDLGPDIFFATITELSAKLKAHEISVLDLTRAFTTRLERIGPRYNALALPLTEHALRRARELDDDIKRDRWRSPLHGIPFAVKDLLAYAGQPTTWGAKPYAAQVFDYTATVVTKLDSAGAVLIGKLAMVELAGGPSYRYAR